MELYIMRHGEAEYRSGPDDQRPLTAAGEHQAAVVSVANKSLVSSSSKVLVSPYLRARQTASLMLANSGMSEEIYEGLQPESNVVALADYLQDLSESSCWLICHMPLAGSLVDYLVEGSTRGMTRLDTADVVCLRGDEWLPGLASLRWHKHWRDYAQ